mgnify:CR=1 FL=1
MREGKPGNLEPRRSFSPPPRPGMMARAFAYRTERGGDRRYWDIALEAFRRQTGEHDATDEMKLFAQYFRNAQRFLWYLSEAARAPMAEAGSNR